MEEILKGIIFDAKWDSIKNEMVKIRQYHVYYDRIHRCVYVDTPFPVKYMVKLRQCLNYIRIQYDNIVIGKPDI